MLLALWAHAISSLVTTALSTLILNVSCSGSNSNVHSGGESGEISIPPLESSSRPESSSGSTSLENHASSSEKDYFSPSSQFSSPSTSTSTPAIDSSPNTEQKESLDFLSGELRSFWKTEIIRAVHERLAEIDPQGNIGRIRDGEIVDALRLDSPLRTRQEMEDILKNVWKRPWPSYEEADRTSIYPRIWDLLEKNKRPDIWYWFHEVEGPSTISNTSIQYQDTPNAVEGQLTERKAGRPPAYYCEGGTQKTGVPP